MPEQTQTAPFIDGLYGKLVEGGIGYFFPSAKFNLLEPDPDPGEHRITRTSGGTYPTVTNTERGKVRIGCVTSVDRALKSRRPVNVGRTSHSSRPTRHLCGWPTDRSVPTRTLSQSDEFVGGAANKSTGAPAAMIVFAYQHETALQVAARDQFLDEQPGHDRLTRTGIVGAPRARLSDPRAQTPTPCARSRFL
jgi:hypothetical protein